MSAWPWREPVVADWEDRGLVEGREAIITAWPVWLLPLAVPWVLELFFDPVMTLKMAAVFAVFVIPIAVLLLRRRKAVTHYRLTLTPDSATLDTAPPSADGRRDVRRDEVARVRVRLWQDEPTDVMLFDSAGRELLSQRNHDALLQTRDPHYDHALPREAEIAFVLASWAPDRARIEKKGALLPARRWRPPALRDYPEWHRRRLRRTFFWMSLYWAIANVWFLWQLVTTLSENAPFGAAVLVTADLYLAFSVWWFRRVTAQSRERLRALAE